MIFLIGERIHGTQLDAGERDCPVCGRTTAFVRVVETRYFTIFGIRLLPIDRVADYLKCAECQNAFGPDADKPTHVQMAIEAVVYIMLGYGMSEHREVAAEICRKVTGFEIDQEEITATVRRIDRGEDDFFEVLASAASTMNTEGKQVVIEAAFLMTYVCCEIQHEDRVRINLLGNAMGVGIEFVQHCIETVRAKHYFGIRRLIPTGSI